MIFRKNQMVILRLERLGHLKSEGRSDEHHLGHTLSRRSQTEMYNWQRLMAERLSRESGRQGRSLGLFSEGQTALHCRLHSSRLDK